MTTQDHVWVRRGSSLVLSLPVTVLDPVAAFVDRYVVAKDGRQRPLPLQRVGLSKDGDVMKVEYLLPETLFDCKPRRLSVACLLVDGKPAIFELHPQDDEGRRLVPADPRRNVRGAVDYFDGERVRGWAYSGADTGDSGEPVGVFFDGELVARAGASALRRDLARKGVEGGRAGFQVALPSFVLDGRSRVLCCASLATLSPLRGGLIRVDRHSLVTNVMEQIHIRIGRLEQLLD